MRKRFMSTAVVLAVTALSLGTGVSANAAGYSGPSARSTVGQESVRPMGACDTSKYFNEVSGSTSSWRGLTPKYHSINGSSGAVTATFQATTSGSYAASLSGTIEGSITNGIATAKASVSSAITKSVSWTTSLSVSTSVPAHSTRYAQYGTNVYKVYIDKVHYSGNCTRSVISNGTLTAPSSVGWKVSNS